MSDPRITDEAVESAAMAMRPILFEDGPAGALTRDERDRTRDQARSALEAALLHLAPQPPMSDDEIDESQAVAQRNSQRWTTVEDSDDSTWPSGLSADNPNLTPAAPQPVVDREALEKLAARYEDLAGPDREFDERSIMSLREEARTDAYRLAARELRALLNGGAS